MYEYVALHRSGHELYVCVVRKHGAVSRLVALVLLLSVRHEVGRSPRVHSVQVPHPECVMSISLDQRDTHDGPQRVPQKLCDLLANEVAGMRTITRVAASAALFVLSLIFIRQVRHRVRIQSLASAREQLVEHAVHCHREVDDKERVREKRIRQKRQREKAAHRAELAETGTSVTRICPPSRPPAKRLTAKRRRTPSLNCRRWRWGVGCRPYYLLQVIHILLEDGPELHADLEGQEEVCGAQQPHVLDLCGGEKCEATAVSSGFAFGVCTCTCSTFDNRGVGHLGLGRCFTQ